MYFDAAAVVVREFFKHSIVMADKKCIQVISSIAHQQSVGFHR